MSRDTYDDLLSDDPAPEKGDGSRPQGTLGGYTLLGELGAGGMGTVYEAEQQGLKRRVALKILAPHLSISTKAIQRFTREGEAAGRQQHPNIVAVYEIGEENGVHYIAQEMVPGGRTLKAKFAEQRELSELPSDHYTQLASLFIKCASALQHAHDSGVVHRDVKPDNILLMPDGEPKVTDFGRHWSRMPCHSPARVNWRGRRTTCLPNRPLVGALASTTAATSSLSESPSTRGSPFRWPLPETPVNRSSRRSCWMTR